MDKLTHTTDPQQEIWLAAELGGDPALLAYQDTVVLELEGAVDEGRFAQAWQTVVGRHDLLERRFSADGTVLEPAEDPLAPWRRRGDLPTGRPGQESWERLCAEEAATPLNLVQGPGFRTLWVTRAPDRHAFVLTVHQLACDAASLVTVQAELAAVYSALAEGRNADLPPAPSFSAYTAALARTWESDDDRTGRGPWAVALAGAVEPLDLPTDFRRPPVRGYEAASVETVIPTQDAQGLEDALLPALAVFVSRLTGQPSFALGLEVSGQDWFGLPGTVGHCVHTLPVPVTVAPQLSFEEWAAQIRSEASDAASRPPVSLRALFQTLGLSRDPSRVPLVPVRFSRKTAPRTQAFGQAKGTWGAVARRFDPSELTLEALDTDGGLVLRFRFLTSLFDPRTVASWAEDLASLLKAAVVSPQTRLQDLPAVSESTRRLFSQWNATARPLPQAPTALVLFEAQVARTPGAPAVLDEGQTLTYRQLDEQANHWARVLVDQGVAPGSLVGVCVGRSARMVAALLGIWKAGAAYVPLDPDYPRDRLGFIAQDSGLKVLITERAFSGVLDEVPLDRIWLDEPVGQASAPPPRTDDPHRLAYVLHTSGSTGKPKGVQIEHRGLVNFLMSFTDLLSPGPNDVLVATTTLSFDIAGLELFLPLCTGARTVIASREVAVDGLRLSQLLARSAATLFQATPSTWQLLVDADWRPPPGFQALCGGEAFPPDLARQLLDRCGKVWNVYGPTETTIWSTVSPVLADEAVPSIGRPIANTQVHIADSLLRPVPIGAAGELLIGGLGLARGYLNQPQMTAERFTEAPFLPTGERVYRTGDLCRWGADGRLHFLRRNDSQVKVRGFRIELGEIDSVLGAYPGVRQAVTQVCRFGANDLRLAAYYTVLPGAQVLPEGLKASVQAKLPAYMVPQYLVVLDDFPLTPNGKIDRKALALPDPGSLPNRQTKAPRTGREEALLTLWKELLQTAQLGIDDDFFQSGGHSLLAAKMTTRIRDTMSVVVSLRTVFQYPTVEGLAAWIEAAQMVAKPGNRGQEPREEMEF